MTEVHRYKVVKMLSESGNRISYDPHGPEVVTAEGYDQLKAENEALRSHLQYLVQNEDNHDENQAERHMVITEAKSTLAAMAKEAQS